MIRRVKKRFDINITSISQSVSKTFELDKSIVAVRGVTFTSDKDDLLYYRGSQRLEINKTEIFPEEYESKLVMGGLNLQPNCRFYRTGKLSPGNGIIALQYKDTPDGRTTFAPYRVSLYVDCDMQEGLV